MVDIIKKIVAWNQNRKLKNAIVKADWMAKKSHCKFLVLAYRGGFLVKSKKELKNLIAIGYFKKGFRVQDAEKIAVYITR